MERALLTAVERAPNIDFIKHCFVVDVITQHHLGYLITKSTPDIECYGVYVLNTANHRIEKILAKVTLLATGGNGQVYRTTTNPFIATGDGVAMVYRPRVASRIWSSSSFIPPLCMKQVKEDRLS
jgi:L-aspartate oxidase